MIKFCHCTFTFINTFFFIHIKKGLRFIKSHLQFFTTRLFSNISIIQKLWSSINSFSCNF